MGNSSSQSTLPQTSSVRNKPLSTQSFDRNDVDADDYTDEVKDPRSPSTGIPRNSFRSRLLVRNGRCLFVLAVESKSYNTKKSVLRLGWPLDEVLQVTGISALFHCFGAEHPVCSRGRILHLKAF